jgi:excisionase family DNA binding protein
MQVCGLGSTVGSGSMPWEDDVRAIVREETRAAVHEALEAYGRERVTAPPAGTAVSAVDDGEEYLSTQRAAVIAGVAAVTIRRWVERGQLREHRAGRLLRIRKDELLALLERSADRGTSEETEDDEYVKHVVAKLGPGRR